MATRHENLGNIDTDVDVIDIQIPLSRVILYNDDYTTFDFVIHILMTVFKKNKDEAVHITMNVHKKGKGVAGAYPREVAQIKVAEVHKLAEEAGFPLRAGVEN